MKFSTYFTKLQEQPWYRQFLNPVINEIPSGSNVLDIGTGSGKLLQLLFKEKQITGIGIDTDSSMLIEAKKKLVNTDILLYKVQAGQDYPFENESFDCITICSVLFNLKEKKILTELLSESLRVLKKNGKLIILTPTGKKGIINLTKHFFSFKNKGIYIWYIATKNSAKRWTKEQYLKKYSYQEKISYKKSETLKGFGQIEILTK